MSQYTADLTRPEVDELGDDGAWTGTMWTAEEGRNALARMLLAERRKVRDIEAETARRIAEWIRPRGFIGSTVTADLIERGEWKKP